MAIVGCAFLASAAQAQILYTEKFNDDGDGVRYTVGGRGMNLTLPDGPSYWEHSFNVGEVGVINRAPARWAALLWSESIDPLQWTNDALGVFDGTVSWASEGRATNLVTYMSPPPTTPSDLFLQQRLIAAGHNVQGLALDAQLPAADGTRLVLISSPTDSTPPTKFNRYAAPLITWQSSGLDDLGLTSIGAAVPVDAGEVTITNPGHPAAGGKSGTIQWTTDPQTLYAPGRNVPAGGQVVATFQTTAAPAIDSLEKVEDLIAGQLGGTTATGMVVSADLAAATVGNWPFNHPVPGAPGDGFAVRGLGQITVDAAGAYSFALSNDDGGRLRIDLDRNGQFDAADDVIVDDASHAFLDSFGSANLQSGNYDFEWLSFDNTGDYASELSVAFNPGGGQTGPITVENWTVLGDHLSSDPVRLVGDISLTTYIAAPVLQERPALVVVDTNGDLLGGRITGAEGAGFFAGADMNDPSYGGGGDNILRTLTLNPIDVAGETDLKLTIAVAGTNIDFESPDVFRILADPDGDGPLPFQVIANYGPTGTGALSFNGHVLGNALEDVTFALPEGATDLVIKFEAYSTFFNEILAFDNIRITAGAPQTPGDTDGDGDVDLDDLNNVRNNFGGQGSGDTDGDSDVDLDDLNNVRNNFGASGAPSSVPEPSTFGLGLGLMALGGIWARRYLGRQ
jgi:hypothetical protein